MTSFYTQTKVVYFNWEEEVLFELTCCWAPIKILAYIKASLPTKDTLPARYYVGSKCGPKLFSRENTRNWTCIYRVSSTVACVSNFQTHLTNTGDG